MITATSSQAGKGQGCLHGDYGACPQGYGADLGRPLKRPETVFFLKISEDRPRYFYRINRRQTDFLIQHFPDQIELDKFLF